MSALTKSLHPDEKVKAGKLGSNMVKAGKVSQGIGMVTGYLEMARLQAGAASRPVEIRFYQEVDSGAFIAFQLGDKVR